MKSSEKFIAGLIVGAAAGVLAALFLQSDKGKEFMNDVKDAAANAGDGLEDLLQKGKDFATDMANKVKEDVSSV